MCLVDTNAISEARKGKGANLGVQDFWQTTAETDLYLCVIMIGEIRRGLENIRFRGDIPQAQKLEAWLNLLVDDYADRILDFDKDCTQVWGASCRPIPNRAKHMTWLSLYFTGVAI